MSKSESNLAEAARWLTSQKPAMVEELVQLCNINSASDNLVGLNAAADHLERLMSDLGSDCTRHRLPSRHWIDDVGLPQESETGPALEWSSPARKGRRVLLAIHYDTVYSVRHALQSCTFLENDRIRGPGVIDAKGGIIVLRWALLAGLRFGLLDSLRWTVVLNPDEEIGSHSSASLWKQIASLFEFGLLFEPAMADGSLVDSRKGSGNFLWLIRGKSAHSGRNFSAGRNAILKTAQLAERLHGLNGQCEGVTLNVGRIHGGGPLNVVPDLCALRFNVRVVDMEQMDWVESQLSIIQAEFSANEVDYRLECEGGLTSPPKIKDATTLNWMAKIEAAATAVGQSIRWKESGGASDGNKLSALGLPNIDTFGPDGDCLHSPDEWVDAASLPKKAALTLSLLAHLGNPVL